MDAGQESQEKPQQQQEDQQPEPQQLQPVDLLIKSDLIESEFHADDNNNDKKDDDMTTMNSDLLNSYNNIEESINLKSITSSLIEINEQNSNETQQQQQQQEQKLDGNEKEQNDLNEDEYEILNKNEELTSIDTKLTELSDKLSMEEIKLNENEIKENENEKLTDSVEDAVLDILGNGSLVKKVLVRGDKEKRPKNGQICTISYKLKLESNLDEIIDQNELFDFVLGDGDVVPALDIAISLMDLNEECELTTDSRHAYGEKGDPPKIPENAKLVYHIKLIKFEYGPELNKLDTIERLSLAEAKKQRGNYHYNRQSYEQAVASYKKGLKYFYDYNLSGNDSKDDLEKFNEIKVTLYMNIALSNYKLQIYNEALEALDNVLKHQNKHVKALFIKGKILMHIGELVDSIKCFNKALEIDDKNADIVKELGRAQAKYKIQYAKEKEMYQKMISGVGTTPESSLTSSSTTQSTKNDSKKTTTKKSTNNNNNNNGSFFSYLATAGVIVAIASIGIAAYAKYKNFI